ncbi:ribosomal protein L13 [Microthyrium microscopicum]|uniref:Large ribosomal subunit protein uL13m n=1 Tax=Microthyrium microscopicum TaxID=703497 RepID=A0A6A6UN96_9PEZI|nr:ribosomal protein L13 [Microthyrium microscopicum]
MSQTIGRTRLAHARTWHHVDLAASPLTLGRVASRIAIALMGKHKPTYSPSTDCGDYIVAVNCAQLKTSGRKMEQKLYYTHTTRPGSLKSISMERLMEKWGGGEVLRRAVRGMLPKNRLRDVRLARLRAFETASHPYKANVVKYPMQGVKNLIVEEAMTKMAAEKARRDKEWVAEVKI